MYFDEKKMWRQAGFEESLVAPSERDKNERRGDSKNEILRFDVHDVYMNMI